MVRKSFVLGLALATALVFLGLAKPAVNPALGAQGPSLRIDAPRSVKVGYPVKISLSVQGARDVGGYEADVLFDKGSAEFASVVQENAELGGGGRDAEPLGFVGTSGGASFGGFSCPVEDCTRPGGSPGAQLGAGGDVGLATFTLVPKRAGRLEVRLAGAEVVDAAGGRVDLSAAPERLVVRVGKAGALRAAPAGLPWEAEGGAPSGTPEEGSDLTGDGRVAHADAMEAAIAWVRAREAEAPCGWAARESGGDADGDGCVDVADVQSVAADHGSAAAGVDGVGPGAEETTAQETSTTDGGDRSLPSLALGAASGLVEWLAPDPARAQSAPAFTVDSAADAADASAGDGACATAQGACTLRAAIQEANLRPGPDAINFNIPGPAGPKTITLSSALPTVNDATGPTTIDGYTQPGSSPNTDPRASNARIGVQLTPAGTYTAGVYGLTVTSPGNAVRGLSFHKLRQPVWLYGGGATNNTVAGNFVGTNASATFAAASFVDEASGVTLDVGANHNIIGGASLADRNVLSGNARHGVAFYGQASDSNRVVNNIMGLSPSGDGRLANVKHGVDVNGGASQNKIGGTLAGEGNVISGNAEVGVEISHEAGTTENEVVGNLIGTDLSGEGAPAHASNGLEGVNLEDRITNNLIAENVVANSGKEGIRGGPQVHGTMVRGNWVGVSRGGAPMPNALAGVQAQGTSAGWRIGPGNTIAHNRGGGVRVINVESDRNTVTRNSIFSNAGLGLDLEPLNTPNQNDANDPDDGPNEQLNFPVIQTSTPEQVSGTACAGCAVEVFLADSGANAYGEGRSFLGSATAGADGRFALALDGAAAGTYVTATATDASGNTSEFSPNSAVSGDTTPPSAPVGLAVSLQGGGIALDWSDNGEADLAGYSVYRSTTAGGPYSRVTPSLLSSSAYADTKAKEGTTYHYVVSATDKSSNESAFGNEASAKAPLIALSFDGVDDWASVPSSNLLNNASTGERTYEAVVRTGSDVARRQFLYEEGGSGNGLSMEVANGRVHFSAWSATNGWGTVSASAPVNPNTSYHVAGVYRQAANELRVYLDGALAGTSSGTVGNMPSHGDAVAVGGISGSTRDRANAALTSGNHFGGKLSEFVAWNHARTAAQVASDAQSDLQGNEAGLILLYKINEGSGTVLNDSGPNRLIATINGASWVSGDISAPTVSGVKPQAGATNVALSSDVEASFSKAMDPSTVNGATFVLTRQGSTASVDGTVSLEAATNKAVLNPTQDLEGGATYEAIVKGGPSGAKDTGGNPLEADERWSFTTIDTTPPETAIDSGPEGTVGSKSATFAFSSSEAGSTFECSLDGAAFSACASPQAYSGLADGTHSFGVRATDKAGNADPTPAERLWTVDTSASAIVLSFDGVDDRVSVPSSNLLNTASTSARTYEALIRTGSDVSRRQFVYEEGGSGNGFSMEVANGRVHFSAWSTTNSWGTVSASAPVAANTAYHVAGVYRQASGDLRLYLDGVLRGTSGGVVGTMPSHGDGVAIGGISGSTRDHANAVLTSGSHFGGKVGEFAAWNHARTAAQVASDSQGDLQGSEAGLILLYEVQEGSGTALNDSTANALHGTISGASWATQ